MKFIALKTCDGGAKGRISFCCKALKLTLQGFHNYLKNRNKPWKHEELTAKMMEILSEDECNDTYGRDRMHKALLLKYPDSGIPSEATVYRVMTAIGITHRPNRKPNGIMKADREARKSDDLLKRDFKSDKPFSKCVTDITEVKAKNGKLYVSAIFDCYDLTAIGLSMDDNMRAELCAATVENTAAAYPEFCGAVLHSDRESQYTSASECLRQRSAADITRIRRANLRPPQWNKYPLRYATWIFIPLHCCSKFLSEMCKAILTMSLCLFATGAWLTPSS